MRSERLSTFARLDGFVDKGPVIGCIPADIQGRNAIGKQRECIQEGILADFLKDNMMEARKVSILFDYDEEAYMRMREEKGRADERYQTVKSMLQRGKTPEEISEFCEYDLSYVKQVEESMMERV